MSMKFKDTIDGSISKNAATAAKLQTKRTINGTEFDGSANITTTNWGTARNIYIADSSSTNKGAAISVNGSGDVTLKLPATIKASLTGNASTASSAAKLTTGRTISITGVANGSATFDGSSNITIATNPTIFSSEGTSGKQGYIEFARMTITGSYTNRPIEFTLISRGRPTSCTVSIAFMNTDNSDPGLSSIKYTGSDYGVFIQKTATSTWAVYATKSEAYDTICLVGKNYVNQSITITHPGTFITTKPTKNITDATLGGTINNSVFADKLKTARTITIGNQSNSFDGSANISYTLSEIGAAASGHTHNYAGSSSAGGAATSANKVNTNLAIKLNGGTTEGTNLFTFNGSAAKTVNITPSSIGAAASSHGTHVENAYATATPKANGTAAVGTSSKIAREDHVHPLQASVSGNAGTATKLQTARTLTIGSTGKTFDGSGNVSWSLSEMGAAAASHGLHFISKTITTGFDTAYRTQTKGNTNSGEYLATIRNDTANIANAPQYGSGLAWGRGDTHGYLCTNYSTPQLYVGGGNENKLNWVKQVSFTDHNHDSKYAAASHGTHVTYSTTAPKVAGTASVGSETSVARGDHVHAAQTSVSGNAGTATKLKTKRTINGTEFDGSANITTANWGTSRKINQISVNGSADVKLPLDHYTCSVGNSNAKPYHHILTTGQCAGDYADKSITIVLVNHYNSAGFGIAKATLRTNQASTGATATGELRWLVRSGFSENSLCYNLRNTARDAYMDVFYKSSGTYDSLTWYVLSEGRRGNHSSEWTKYNTHHDNGTNVYNETGMKAIRTYTSTLQSAVDHGAVNSAKTAAACSGNAATATKLQTAKTLTIGNKGKTFDGSGNVGWTLAEIGAAASGHTHNQINSRGDVTCESGAAGRPAVSGLSMSQAYNNGYPTTYGNVINLKGTGDGQILVGWPGSDGAHAPVYVRSKRDNTTTANWSQWAQFYTTANKPTPSDIGAAASGHSHNENTLTRTLVTKTASSNKLTLGTERYQLASGLSNGGTINLPASPALLTEINLIINNVSLTTLNLPDTCKWRVDHNLEVGKYFMITFLYVATNVWLTEIKVYS